MNESKSGSAEAEAEAEVKNEADRLEWRVPVGNRPSRMKSVVEESDGLEGTRSLYLEDTFVVGRGDLGRGQGLRSHTLTH
jgi:hypothetical protein